MDHRLLSWLVDSQLWSYSVWPTEKLERTIITSTGGVTVYELSGIKSDL